MTKAPTVCIYGAGAIGGMIGVLLARAGVPVSVVARGATLAALRTRGLRLITDGETLQADVRAVADPAELGPQDYVIVAVKAPALAGIAPAIAPLLGPETAVVTAMNGVPWWFFANGEGPLAGQGLKAVDPDGVIAGALPVARAIGCVVHLACSVVEPGLIRHATNLRLIIGEADNRPTPRLDRLHDWLTRAGFDSVVSAKIQQDVWFKLWGNLSLNPISLLTEATMDRIIDDPLTYDLCRRMMRETAAIGEAIGLPIDQSVDDRLTLARELGAFKTSMLQDLENRKPVEIDALLTATREIGQRVGIPTPFIDAVLGLARLRARGLGLLA
ncbi:MAG TPA: 2-dehydropantoate 2-reductase [Stellaceae bacterium]|nr:2-dehydropantoate 2-reductase [Stellaceae bacterium]